MDIDKPTDTYAVLDLETRPDPLAVSIMRARAADKAGQTPRPALQRIVAAALLTGERTSDGTWSDLKLASWDVADGEEHAALVKIGTVLGILLQQGAKLVTYNGRAHDLPLLRRRAAAHWLFDLSGLTKWHQAGPERHIDLMANHGADGERWSSLREACAPLSIQFDHEDAHSDARPIPLAVRKAQCDVVATFLLLLHSISLHEESVEDVSRGWVALADMLRVNHGFQKHLDAFRTNGRIDIAREHLARIGASSRSASRRT